MILVLQILVLITACCFIFGYGCHFIYFTLVGVASNHVAVYWSSETKKNSVSSDPKLEVLPYMVPKYYIVSYAKSFHWWRWIKFLVRIICLIQDRLFNIYQVTNNTKLVSIVDYLNDGIKPSCSGQSLVYLQSRLWFIHPRAITNYE